MVGGHVRQVVVLYSNICMGELACADPGLVVLDEWLSYRGGCLSRFDYIIFIKGDRVGKPDTVIV